MLTFHFMQLPKANQSIPETSKYLQLCGNVCNPFNCAFVYFHPIYEQLKFEPFF